MKRMLVLAVGVCVVAIAFACGGDDDNNNGGGGGETIDCNGTQVQLSDFPNCVRYLEELGKCCPNAADAYKQAASATVCGGDDAACKALVDNSMAMTAACNQLKQIPQCQ